jgi:hypothetical protein
MPMMQQLHQIWKEVNRSSDPTVNAERDWCVDMRHACIQGEKSMAAGYLSIELLFVNMESENSR